MSLKPVGRCIFCDKPGSLSKQHIIPDRLKKLVPRTAETYTQTLTSYPGERPSFSRALRRQREHQGHAADRKWRKVCIKCNGGWIKNIETEAFDNIADTILDKDQFLNEEDQHKISLMAAIITCMADVDKDSVSCINYETRSWIKNNRRLPENWLALIGRRNVCWEGGLRHHGSTILVTDPNFIGPIINKTQITSIGMGHLMLQCVSAPNVAALDLLRYSTAIKGHCLHPFTGNLDTSQLIKMNNSEVIFFADHLMTNMLR